MPEYLTEGLRVWALTYLVHSTLLLGIAWLIGRRLTDSHGIREALWKTALVGGIVTATLQSGLAFRPLGGVVSLGGEDSRREAAAAPRAVAGFSVAGLRIKSAESASAAPAPIEEAVGGEPTATASQWTWPSAGLLVSAWLGVALVLVSGFLVIRARAIRRIGPREPVSDPGLNRLLDELRQMAGVERPIRLTSAPSLPSPVALGSDEICVPQVALRELDEDQKRTMLAHELAHLTRRDPHWLTVSCILERLFFFQPLNRLARSRIQEAAEFLCDDWAVRQTGGGLPLAKCLVKVAEWVDTRPHPVPVSAMAERRSQLMSRIHRLIENRPMPNQPSRQLLLAGALGLIVITAAFAPGVTARPSSHDPEVDRPDLLSEAEPDLQDPAAVPVQADTDEVRSAKADHRAMLRAERALHRAQLAGPSELRRPVGPTAVLPASRLHALRAELALMGRSQRRDTTSAAVPALIGVLKDSNVEVRRAAASALANYEDPRSVPAFIEALKDSDAEVRATAAGALGELGDTRAVGPLGAMVKDANSEVRCQALRSLGNLGAPVPGSVLIEALSDKDPEVRQIALNLAADQMEDGKNPSLFTPVAALLKDPSAEVRHEAVRTLINSHDPKAADLVAPALHDQDADVRAAAADGLGELDLKAAPSALLEAARDPKADVRHEVAHSLGEIGDPKAVPVLKTMLTDQDPDVREAAVEGLAEIRDGAALDALIQALKSTDPVVRRSAAEALGQRGD